MSQRSWTFVHSLGFRIDPKAEGTRMNTLCIRRPFLRSCERCSIMLLQPEHGLAPFFSAGVSFKRDTLSISHVTTPKDSFDVRLTVLPWVDLLEGDTRRPKIHRTPCNLVQSELPPKVHPWCEGAPMASFGRRQSRFVARSCLVKSCGTC